MKKIIIILLFGLCKISYSQDTHKLVLDYVNDQYGERVGHGVCCELIWGAMSYKDSIIGSKDSVMIDIKESEIAAGDVMTFYDVTLADGTIIKNHGAIIYRISGSGFITLAHQNVSDGKGAKLINFEGKDVYVENDSRVVFSFFDLSQVVSGKIIYSRL